MKILIVDDNNDITSLLSNFLRLQKFECVSTNNGHNAVSLIRQNKFDLVILDLAMPEFDGFEVIKSLEDHGLMNRQRVIVLTASTISNDQSDQLLGKNITVLRKPVQLPELLQAVH